MFEIPGAKRVKREDLFDQTSSFSASDSGSKIASKKSDSEPDSDERDSKHNNRKPEESNAKVSTQHPESQDIQPNYGFEYDFIDKTPTQRHQESNTAPPDQPRAQTYEFLLFKPDTTSSQAQATTTQSIAKSEVPQINTITLRSPTPDQPGEGSIIRSRPHSYYLTSFQTTQKQQTLQHEYREAAISGDTIHVLAGRAWPGTHLPWRVRHIHAKQGRVSDVTVKKGGRTRPSKKRRILLRSSLALHLARQVEVQKGQEEKEIAEREKKTRRNREKKVKRKEREKRKKLDGSTLVDRERADGPDVDG